MFIPSIARLKGSEIRLVQPLTVTCTWYIPLVTGCKAIPVALFIATLLRNHWLPTAAEDNKSPTFWVMVGFAGFGVTVSAIALVVMVTGVTQFALDVSLLVITSRLAGAVIVMELKPAVPGMAIPFLNQLITGEVPGLALVNVNVADSPLHNDVFGVAIEAVCVTFGDTITVIALEVAVAGVAQEVLVVWLDVIISLVLRFDKVIVINPLVPGIITPFLNQEIVGEAPPLLEVRLNVAV